MTQPSFLQITSVRVLAKDWLWMGSLLSVFGVYVVSEVLGAEFVFPGMPRNLIVQIPFT